MPRKPFPPDALAVVTDPARVDCHPALMQDAWFRLMESCRGPVSRDRVLRLQARHIIRTDAAQPPCDTVAQIDAIRARIPHRVRARMAHLQALGLHPRRTGGAA